MLTRVYAGVAPDVAKALDVFAVWLRAFVAAKDDVVVHLVPNPVVGNPDDARDQGFACFLWPVDRERTTVNIYVGCGLVDECADFELTRAAAIDVLLENLAHEFAHYVQWAQGGDPDEEHAEFAAPRWVALYKHGMGGRLYAD